MEQTLDIIKADTIEQYNRFFRIRDTPPVGWHSAFRQFGTATDTSDDIGVLRVVS